MLFRRRYKMCCVSWLKDGRSQPHLVVNYIRNIWQISSKARIESQFSWMPPASSIILWILKIWSSAISWNFSTEFLAFPSSHMGLAALIEKKSSKSLFLEQALHVKTYFCVVSKRRIVWDNKTKVVCSKFWLKYIFKLCGC